MKVIAYGMIPAILMFVGAIFWTIKYLYKKLRSKELFELKRSITVTCYILIYFFYPIIVNLTLSLFICTKLEDENGNLSFYLVRDMSVKCWTRDHYKYAIGIAVPLSIVWILGFPFYIFWKLYKARRNLNDKEVLLSYGVFIVGLEDNSFFWEILVSNFRKVIYIACGAFMTFATSSVKVRLSLLIFDSGDRWRLDYLYVDTDLQTLQALH